MTAYISARFEKDTLPSGLTVRVITRNIDQGAVPPSPTATYFPTHPDEYQTFIVGSYIDETQGEEFVRVAVLADLTAEVYRPLQVFSETGAFLSVLADDQLEINPIPTDDRWISEEYPSSTFVSTITSVTDDSNVVLATELPAFALNLTWTITRPSTGATIATGTAGATRREGVVPGGGTQDFLEKRFNSYFTTAVAAENFVVSVKTNMTALSNEALGESLTTEQFTAEPTT